MKSNYNEYLIFLYLRALWVIEECVVTVICTLREEPYQIKVILQQTLPAAKWCAVCAVYNQRLTTSACNCGLRTAVKTQDTIPYFTYRSYCFYIITNITVILLFLQWVYGVKSTLTFDKEPFYSPVILVLFHMT